MNIGKMSHEERMRLRKELFRKIRHDVSGCIYGAEGLRKITSSSNKNINPDDHKYLNEMLKALISQMERLRESLSDEGLEKYVY